MGHPVLYRLSFTDFLLAKVLSTLSILLKDFRIGTTLFLEGVLQNANASTLIGL